MVIVKSIADDIDADSDLSVIFDDIDSDNEQMDPILS